MLTEKELRNRIKNSEIELKTPNSFTIKRTRKRYHEKNVVN